MLEKNEDMKWGNEDNQDFYEVVQAEGLQKFSEKGGLASGCDIQVLTPYWSQAQSILEVGAGYGRVIDYLLKHQFQGTITAVERCNVLFEYLQNKFNQYKNVRLLHKDVRYLNDVNARFDLILMLWSTIAEFSPSEQPLVLARLKKLLNKGGKLIVDTMPENLTPLQAYKFSRQIYITKVNNTIVSTWEPVACEMKQFAKKARFFRVDCITCQTDIGRGRQLYILN